MKWEYMMWVRDSDMHPYEVQLNKFGFDGWELCAIINRSCYFKRPIPQAAE